MELRIRPDDLRAAAVALSAAARRLELATLDFEHVAVANAVDLGMRTFGVTTRGITATSHAVGAVAIDVRRLAQALAALAEHYPAVDDAAIPPR
ncbi:MAG: hypothetical protein JO246_11930 [Frankiaceae bacterium]|nr:hypothetical protein [Frankiaceae bacterium]MBV9871606.1 hypothetical protein [Frankiaceae bacterium]